MRYQPIPSSLFADRRKEFSKKMTRGSIAIFYSAEPAVRNVEQYYPFRQDSDMFALSGLDQPGSILILFPSAKEASRREFAFTLSQKPEHIIWHGKYYTAKEVRKLSGIQSVFTLDQWDKIMNPLFKAATNIYFNPAYTEKETTDEASRIHPNIKALLLSYPKHTFLKAYPILRDMRMIKHPVELDMMKTAIGVTAKAFDRVLQTIRPGLMEYEVEAELAYVLSKNGCHHAFEPIVASGESACILHYIRNDKIIRKDELVLIDFGAEYANMASDMSRTIPASGRFTKRQRQIYSAVHHVLNEVTAMMRPGMTFDQLNKETGKLIDSALVKLKLTTRHDLRHQDPASPLRRKYFMHGVSHHLGYDVHDISDRSAPFKPGMVLTCEPGLYIPEEKIGIRLENDILITRGKPKNLMEAVPIDAEEIEEMMA